MIKSAPTDMAMAAPVTTYSSVLKRRQRQRRVGGFSALGLASASKARDSDGLTSVCGSADGNVTVRGGCGCGCA